MTSVAAQAGTTPSPEGALASVPIVADQVAAQPGVAVPVRRPWLQPGADLAVVGAALAVVRLLDASLPIWVMVAVPLLWLSVRAAGRGYARPLGLPTPSARVGSVLRAGSSLALVMWVAVVVAGVPQQGGVLALTLAVTAGSVVAQLLLDSLDREALDGAPRRAVVAGSYDQVRLALDELRRAPHAGVDVVAVCLSEAAGAELFDVPTHVGFEQLPEAVTGADADTAIILPTETLGPRDLQRLGWRLEASRTDLYLGSGLVDVAVARSTVTNVGGLHLLRIGLGRRQHLSRAVKNVWERVAAVVLLIALSPLLLGLALLVRLDSRGPVVFRQPRVGREGRPFTMLKFRTMDVDHATSTILPPGENDCDGVLFKLRLDPRITRVGRLLRRYSLDELPQLVNVVTGQMALVGPRPALPGEVDRYDHDPRRRLVVKPGLTGLWQVSGRSDLPWEEAVRLDLLYVDNWSLTLDLAILARTAGAVLRHRGAY